MSNFTHPFIWTASGNKWVIDDLQPDMIQVDDICCGLAKECRFGGQIEGFYSVARHSIILTNYIRAHKLLPEHDLLAVLLHDAAEAYLGDMPKPIKVTLPDYNKLEEAVMKVIAQRFGLQYPFPDVIKQCDTRIVIDEAFQLFACTPPWIEDFSAAGITPLGIDVGNGFDHSWMDDARDFQNLLTELVLLS